MIDAIFLSSWTGIGHRYLQKYRKPYEIVLYENHSTALTISSMTFFASPKTIMVLSM
jgi:hypothetical protein